MALIRWEPVAELNTIQNEMNRLFNTYFDQPNQTGRGNGTMRRWMPPMDLVETGDHYVLGADLPGLSDGDVNLQLEDNVLHLSGERKAGDRDRPDIAPAPCSRARAPTLWRVSADSQGTAFVRGFA